MRGISTILPANLFLIAGWIAYGSCENLVTPSFKLDTIPFRYDYKQSFKYPFFLHNVEMPYFNMTGDVIPGRDYLRVAPSVPNRAGSVMSKTPNPHHQWSVNLTFVLHGRGPLGGKGFAFWYVKDNSEALQRDFYGRPGTFEGLGIIMDLSDVNQNRFNPFIYGVTNDGKKSRDDFKNYENSDVTIGSCYREIRNTPHPVHMRVSYYKKSLIVEVDVNHRGHDFVLCFEKKEIELPTGHYFGVSAMTDGFATDDHDIYALESYELEPPKHEHKDRPHEQEHIKSGHEFHMKKEYQEEIEKVQKIVKQEREKDFMNHTTADEILNPELFQRLEGNQFHIIEALDHLQQKLNSGQVDSSKTGTSSHETSQDSSKLSQQVGNLHNDVQQLSTEIKTLKENVADLVRKQDRLLNALESSTRVTHGMISDTHASLTKDRDMQTRQQILQSEKHASTIYNALYLFATLAGIAIVLYVYSVYVRTKDRDMKKFI